MELQDTSNEVRRRQIELYRAMTPGQRVAIALEMSEAGRQIALDGIRSRRPELDVDQVLDEYVRMLHGDDAADRRRARRAG
ncbi:MAG: hypothetical protein JJE52_14750 [Acidimicrobiia bacterium]|nr:hypothetical protein [Acidimicrobiia bacterium]